MESKEGSTASQKQHHTGANYRLHSEYKTKGVSHHSIHIWSTRTTESSCHCLQDISTETVARQTTMGWTTSCSSTTRMESSATDHSQTVTRQDQQKGHLCQCYQHSTPWILRQQWTSLWSLSVHSLHRQQQQIFMCSTSKVAPLKQLTIPRLELCAAILLSKLYKKAIRALNITINES